MMLPSQPRTEEPQIVQEESRYPTHNRRPPERLTYYDHVTPTPQLLNLIGEECNMLTTI